MGNHKKPFKAGKSWRHVIHAMIVGLFILKLLCKEPKHGYELAENLNKILNINIPRQVIYFILRKFERMGLVRSEWSIKTENRPKRIYYITSEGKEFLEDKIRTMKRIIQLLESI